MKKVYDDFVKKNPTLFKVATLDLFVKVGFLSQEVYVNAKSEVEAYQSELKAREEAATSASVSNDQAQQSTSNSENSSATNSEQSNTLSSSEESENKEATTIV